MDAGTRTKPLIIVVDDDGNFREIIGMKLRTSGFDVETFKDVEEAVQKVKELQPDLVLMDIQMPGKLNGIDAAFRIKENPETAGVKVAFLSNAADPWPMVSGDKAAVSKEFGMEDFIPKTDDLDVLVGKVKALLGIISEPTPEPAPEPTPESTPEAAPPPMPPSQ
jgi:two-component system alkaline phosphatase synthesis response regulator PhoP